MSLEPFWGIKSIVQCLGLQNSESFYRAYEQGRVFAFKRIDPNHPHHRMWYTNLDLMARCELAQAKLQWEAY